MQIDTIAIVVVAGKFLIVIAIVMKDHARDVVKRVEIAIMIGKSVVVADLGNIVAAEIALGLEVVNITTADGKKMLRLVFLVTIVGKTVLLPRMCIVAGIALLSHQREVLLKNLLVWTGLLAFYGWLPEFRIVT